MPVITVPVSFGFPEERLSLWYSRTRRYGKRHEWAVLGGPAAFDAHCRGSGASGEGASPRLFRPSNSPLPLGHMRINRRSSFTLSRCISSSFSQLARGRLHQ